MKVKRVLVMLAWLALASYGPSAQAMGPDGLTLDDLPSGPQAGPVFAHMVRGWPLPRWVSGGAVTSPAQKVRLAGRDYWLLEGCKPHDCAAESLAILYDPVRSRMSGVYSHMGDEGVHQSLTWLNTAWLDIDGRTVLLAALTGSLGNHPGMFNSR